MFVTNSNAYNIHFRKDDNLALKTNINCCFLNKFITYFNIMYIHIFPENKSQYKWFIMLHNFASNQTKSFISVVLYI